MGALRVEKAHVLYRLAAYICSELCADKRHAAWLAPGGGVGRMEVVLTLEGGGEERVEVPGGKIKAGAFELKEEPFELRSIVDETVAMVRHLLHSKPEVVLNVDAPRDLRLNVVEQK